MNDDNVFVISHYILLQCYSPYDEYYCMLWALFTAAASKSVVTKALMVNIFLSTKNLVPHRTSPAHCVRYWSHLEQTMMPRAIAVLR